MQPADLLAIMTFQGGAVRVKQDFTDNRAQLREVIQTLIFGDDKDGDGIPDTADIGTAFGQDDAEFNILNTDRQLSALQTAVDDAAAAAGAEVADLLRQRPAAERRRQPGAAARHDQRRDPRQRRRSSRSTRAAWWRTAPLGDATRPSPGGIGMFTGQLAQRRDDATSSGRRTRSTRSRRTPAARRCSTTTICRWASCRRPRR